MRTSNAAVLPLEMDEKATALWRDATRIDEDLLAALPLMPETSGVALGFDRLVLLAVGRAADRPT